MKITFDPAKRQAALAERGLNFADAEIVFAGPTITVQDTRREYGEGTLSDRRISCGSNGDGGLDAARRSAAYYLDEKVQ